MVYYGLFNVLCIFFYFNLGWTTPIIDVQLSPKKALRAEMLKGRFADTILKAQQKMLLDPVVTLTFSVSVLVSL